MVLCRVFGGFVPPRLYESRGRPEVRCARCREACSARPSNEESPFHATAYLASLVQKRLTRPSLLARTPRCRIPEL